MIGVNILFIATSSNASSGGGRTRIVDVALETKKNNFEPKILCFIPGSQVVSGLIFLADGKARLEKESGAKVYYVPALPFTRIVLIDWLNNWYCGLVIFLLCRWFDIKVVYGHGTKASNLAVFAKKFRKKIKVLADIQGAIAEEDMYYRGIDTADMFSRRIEQNEAITFANADRLLFVSRAMQVHYEKKYKIAIRNCAVIPCATRKIFTFHAQLRDQLRREYGLMDKLVFCYIGSIESYQMPKQMCELFKKITERFPSAFFLVLSHQASVFKNYLRAAAISDEAYKVLTVEHEKVVELLQIADIGFLLRDNSIVNRVASPTKFAEYVSCGLPVLTTDFVGDFSKMVKEHDLGHIIDLADLSVNERLVTFINNVQEKRFEYALRCSTYIRENLLWDIHGKHLSKIFTDLYESK
ncbi:MAG: glycosyltransferase [Chloroflexi bacterium]|nr:glycosyltransferase [Chloroflexota bacterium]